MVLRFNGIRMFSPSHFMSKFNLWQERQDKDLLHIKLYYFLNGSGHGCIQSFLTVILRQKGLSPAVIGAMYTIITFTGLINKTLSAAIADLYKIHKTVFLTGLCMIMITYAGIYFSPSLVIEKESSSIPDDSTDKVKPPDLTILEALSMYKFYIIFFLMISEVIGATSANVMGETVCMSVLGNDTSKYGRQRFCQTLGWGSSALIGGLLIDYNSKNNLQADFRPIHLMSAFFMTMNIINIRSITFNIPPVKTNFRNLQGIFTPPVFLILISIGIVGITGGMIGTFKLIFMEDVAREWQPDFPYMKSLQGLLLFVQCIFSQAPAFFLSGYIITRIGYYMVFVVSFCTQCLRICLFSQVMNPWLFLPIGLFDGFAFGLVHASMTSYANSVTVKGTEATTQAIFHAVGQSCAGIGTVIGGGLFTMYGGRKAFLIIGIFNGIYALIFLTVYFAIKKYYWKTHDYSLVGR